MMKMEEDLSEIVLQTEQEPTEEDFDTFIPLSTIIEDPMDPSMTIPHETNAKHPTISVSKQKKPMGKGSGFSSKKSNDRYSSHIDEQ